MGLPAPVVQLFFAENARRPIDGDVGFIAKQTTYVTEQSVKHLSGSYGIDFKSRFQFEIDSQTRNHSWNLGGITRWITDRSLMTYLGAKSFKAIDISEYEGADIICDLTNDVPLELHNSFDFVYNGSCLDNVFNPAKALINLSRLLRPGGRLVVVEHATWFNNPYSIFSPGWFFDYFVCNKYVDCQVYLAIFNNNVDLHIGPWSLFYYNWMIDKGGSMPHLTEGQNIILLVVAEKGRDSTDDVSPIQHQYRSSSREYQMFDENAQRIQALANKLFVREDLIAANPRPYLHCFNLGEGMLF